jgi:large subunit ribosomal protein L2
MAIRLYKAYSPGTRFKSVSYFDDLLLIKPEKALTFGKKACGGRNNRGVITVRGCGGGHKRKYRHIDFHRKSTIVANVSTIEYDPNRNARIALLRYKKAVVRLVSSDSIDLF